MIKLNAVNCFFIFLALLVAGGELHRVLTEGRPEISSEKMPLAQTAPAGKNAPAKPPEAKKTNAPKPLPIKEVAVPKPLTASEVGFVFPVPGKSKSNLIGRFGDPRGGGKRKHEGVDIAAPRGTAVVAVADGTVVKVKAGGNGGKQVWMEDKKRNWTYYYAHLHSQSVEVGQEVAQGTELGTVGSTGNAPKNCPHLHFLIYEPGLKAIDPLPMLP